LGPDDRSDRDAPTRTAQRWTDEANVACRSIEVLNGDEFSYARSKRSPKLDLAYPTTPGCVDMTTIWLSQPPLVGGQKETLTHAGMHVTHSLGRRSP
jgi:hypothetical protein